MTPDELRADNARRAKAIGCKDAMADAQSCGLSDEDKSVAMDALAEDGWDACAAFMAEQTNGRYPPRHGLLPTSPPDKWIGSRPLKRKVWWDCIQFGAGIAPQRQQFMFGNANIGAINLCNLRVAESLSSNGGGEFLAGWGVTTNLLNPDALDLVHALLADSVFELIGGHRIEAERHGADLLREAQPIATEVRPQSRLEVRCRFYNETALRGLDQWSHDYNKQTRIWVNLEGWSRE